VPRPKKTAEPGKKSTAKRKKRRSGDADPDGSTLADVLAAAPVPSGEPAAAPDPGFPVVGIGASAGGLAALEAFFSSLPKESATGTAFVVVQHLDPDHKSILIDLIRQYTRMEVVQAKDGAELKPDFVYVIPPNRDLAVDGCRLRLFEPEVPRGMRLPIDFFLRSLAGELRERAICIILSGTGTDGTLGLKAVKGEGGMAMVQSPETAAYDGMPRSAIATAQVDYILAPEKLAAQLLSYVERTFGRQTKPGPEHAAGAEGDLHRVFLLLRARTGHDFSQYKRNTLLRRIQRRMIVAQINRLEDYVVLLRSDTREVDTLFRELLIGVTSFFRDPHAFAVIEKTVIPEIFRNAAGRRVRIWLPGCSTGEEAYSLAILLREYLDDNNPDFPLQIFATDIDTESIDRARAGVYPGNIAADVSPERLARFFTFDAGVYRIRKSLRDMVVFAKQDVLKDPPFSRLDLISCRNLMIYLSGEAQHRLVPIFHYALNEEGFLFLGNSETIGRFAELFAVVDKRWKIYRRASGSLPQILSFPITAPATERAGRARPAAGREAPRPTGLRELAQQSLLESYVPAGVLVNSDFEVLYIHGRIGRFLEPAAGEANLNLLQMARGALRVELAAAIGRVFAQGVSVRREGVQVTSDGDAFLTNIIVSPVVNPDAPRGLALVIFEEGGAPEAVEPRGGADSEDAEERRLAALEGELRAKEEYLQTTVEELETANEELKSTNEELQSSNEELQSTNEEMENSKEELQSVNEELITVNTELQKKIEEFTQTANDLNNLLAATNIATLFVDQRLRIQRFTPAVAQLINVIATDVGRPVSDIASRLTNYTGLVDDIREVLDSLVPKEAQVRTADGRWYQMRIQPYRTAEHVIEGAVLTFVDISRERSDQAALRESEFKFRNLFEQVPIGVGVLNSAQKLVYANAVLERMLAAEPGTLTGDDFAARAFFRPDGSPFPPAERPGAQALARNREIQNVDLAVQTRKGRTVRIRMSAIPINLPEWKVALICVPPQSAEPEPQEKG
jgi:two-component system CheB/CheR fusion protein